MLRWNGITEDFQEECYHVPDIVQDEFQAVQGQIAVRNIAVFWMIFFELLVFFTFTFLTLHFAY